MSEDHDPELAKALKGHALRELGHADTALVTMLTGCVYTLLTLASTRDKNFMIAGAEMKLPIVGVALPTVVAIVVIPLVLLAAFIYYHYCASRVLDLLLRLRHETGELDADLREHGRLRLHIGTWVLGPEVGTRLEERLVRLALYLAVPVCLWLIYGRSIAVHDIGISLAHVGTLLVALGAALYYWGRKGQHRHSSPALGVGLVASTAGLLYLTVQICTGETDLNLNAIGVHTTADFGDQRLVTAPKCWREYESPDTDCLQQVRSLRREWSNLDGANLRRSFLPKVRAEGASFRGAVMRYAQLQGARLNGAKFDGADMKGVRLQRTIIPGGVFSGACLQQSVLDFAVLPQASFRLKPKVICRIGDKTTGNLHGASLKGAQMIDVDLGGAGMYGAAIAGTRFDYGNLRGAQLRLARGEAPSFRCASLQVANLHGIEAPGADFRGAVLTQAKLSESNLRGSSFETAELGKARFVRSKLRGADFRSAGLGQAVLVGARARDARFDDSQAHGARFIDADLRGAVFDGATLHGAKFAGARLEGAHMDFVDLEGFELDCAQVTSLCSADFELVPEALRQRCRGEALAKLGLTEPPGYLLALQSERCPEPWACAPRQAYDPVDDRFKPLPDRGRGTCERHVPPTRGGRNCGKVDRDHRHLPTGEPKWCAKHPQPELAALAKPCSAGTLAGDEVDDAVAGQK